MSEKSVCTFAGIRVTAQIAIAALVAAMLVASAGASGPTTRGDELTAAQRAQIKCTVIGGPPQPPKGAVRAGYSRAPLSAVLLTVPTSTWTYGCTATSAGMLFGYYDRNGYPNMYTGSTNGGVCPLVDLGQGDDPSNPVSGACSIIATMDGFDGRSGAGHVDDYWVSYGSSGPDPWVSGGTEHTWGDCTADYMGTNQWRWDFDGTAGTDSNSDGSTSVWTYTSGNKLYDYVPEASMGTPQTSCCHGMRLFAESRGYTVVQNYNQKVDAQVATGGFTLANFRDEIDAGRPVLVHLDGHTVLGVGYDTSDTTKIYIHDTWDNILHSMTWGGYYTALIMESVTVIELQAPASANTAFMSTQTCDISSTGHFYAGAWCYGTGTWVGTADNSYSGTLSYTMNGSAWTCLYLYDYDSGSWSYDKAMYH